jgi:hypothetical protein
MFLDGLNIGSFLTLQECTELLVYKPYVENTPGETGG